jgi:hypothetical protein
LTCEASLTGGGGVLSRVDGGERCRRFPLRRKHGRMARGAHGLPKVSLGPAMPDPSTPCGRATRETGERRSAVFYPYLDTPRCTLVGKWVQLTVILNVSKMRLNLESLFEGFDQPNQITPCGRPSLDQPEGRSSENRPQGVITTYKMTINWITLN